MRGMYIKSAMENKRMMLMRAGEAAGGQDPALIEGCFID
jgi:hypothetical protein